MSENELKKIREGISIIRETCSKMKLTPFANAVSQALLVCSFDYKSDISSFASTCILLASKITENTLNKEQLKMIAADASLEIMIADRIGFEFYIVNVFSLVRNIARTVNRGKPDTLQEKFKKISNVFSDGIIKRFAPFGSDFYLQDLGISLFTDEEIKLFEKVNCIEVDMDNVKKIRTLTSDL